LVLTRRTVDLAREGFDVAIRASISSSLPSSALIAKRLGPNNIALYASAGYAARRELPKHPEDLREHDNVVFFPNDAAEYQLKGPKGFTRVKVPGRVSGDDFFFIREAVLAGLGVGALPTFMATQELAAGRLVPVLPEYQSALGSIYVLYPSAKPLPAKVTAFTTYVREHAPRLL
jgi:DNA-binding transcriptional LysR family regulator